MQVQVTMARFNLQLEAYYNQQQLPEEDLEQDTAAEERPGKRLKQGDDLAFVGQEEEAAVAQEQTKEWDYYFGTAQRTRGKSFGI